MSVMARTTSVLLDSLERRLNVLQKLNTATKVGQVKRNRETERDRQTDRDRDRCCIKHTINLKHRTKIPVVVNTTTLNVFFGGFRWPLLLSK